MPLLSNNPWKEHEARYLRGLVSAKGSREVGFTAEAVASYLDLQSADAKRSGEAEISEAAAIAATLVRAGRWGEAVQVLN